MDKKLAERLKCRYPLVTRDLTSIDCGNGWFSIIDAALRQLDRMAQTDIMSLPRRPHLRVTRIEGRYGRLEIWTLTTDGAVLRVTEAAMRASEKTCEKCGRPMVCNVCE